MQKERCVRWKLFRIQYVDSVEMREAIVSPWSVFELRDEFCRVDLARHGTARRRPFLWLATWLITIPLIIMLHVSIGPECLIKSSLTDDNLDSYDTKRLQNEERIL